METAVAWSIAIGSILISIGAAIYWGSGSKSVGLWAGFIPGVIALVFAAGFQVQNNILKAEVPADKPEDINHRQLRAYVGVIGFHIVKFKVGEPIQAQIIFSNAGQTPAYNVKYRFSRMDIDQFPAPPYEPTPLPPDTETGGATIAPKGTYVVSPLRSHPLEDIEFNALQPNTRVISNAIYIQGVLTYRDAFRQLRTTRFYGAYGGPYGIDQTGAVAIMDGPGNESD